MSHVIEAFLATEITCLPQLLDRYVGRFYSNKIGNGATWVFLMWHVLHFIFEESINCLLKRIRTREFVRVRLKQSVWYLGFYIACFAYCTATLFKDDNNNYAILGFVILCTFYVHTIVWEALERGLSISSASYLLLTTFILLTYFTRKIELSLSLLAIVSLTQFGIELARCILTMIKSDSTVSRLVGKIMLWGSVCLFAVTHGLVIPFFFILPLGFALISAMNNVPIILLNVTLWLWLTSELFNNPLYKFVKHWVYHDIDTLKTVCPGSSVECSLFQPRDDAAFNFKLIRQEIKEREEKMMSLRKPKNRGMLLQTLKCMVAIKKKLKEKRRGDVESSDSDSEPDTPNDTTGNSNMDEENAALLTPANLNDIARGETD